MLLLLDSSSTLHSTEVTITGDVATADGAVDCTLCLLVGSGAMNLVSVDCVDDSEKVNDKVAPTAM